MLAMGYTNISTIYLGLLKSNQKKDYTLVDMMVFGVVILSLLGFVRCVHFVFSFLSRFCILPVINRIVARDATSTLRGNVDHIYVNKVYDTFILHSEEDYHWISTSLIPYLEQDLGLSVCLPDRDFHQGGNTIQSVMAAMVNSRKVIVVLTPDYMAERGCYALQVEHLLLPSLYEGDRNELSVLLLNLARCEIPRPLRWNFDIKCIKWYEYPENESRKQLEWWIKQK